MSYRGDDAIEIKLERSLSTAQAAPAASPLLVTVNSYRASDGTRYATAITAARQIFLPAVQK